jgi:hypothetical protein
MSRSNAPVIVSEAVRGRAAMSLAVGLLAAMAALLAMFSVGVNPAQAVTIVTATATSNDGDASELSLPVRVKRQ